MALGKSFLDVLKSQFSQLFYCDFKPVTERLARFLDSIGRSVIVPAALLSCYSIVDDVRPHTLVSIACELIKQSFVGGICPVAFFFCRPFEKRLQCTCFLCFAHVLHLGWDI